MPIPWLFLLVSVVGFWFTYNAYRPMFRPAIFSVLSFFGSGGFVVGAILGIIGGIMILRWRRPVTVVQAATSVP